ncbi:uncharacterized protein PHALS_09587 [Plasmopara halstedii]|uniref:Uncharacterized protein n=1 Tax=Plasmopara halstedii TaxID=4781 RepID=A0A0P1AFH3_PLAHL|nr:uncharacterized protein PHALS_09587 [Plasmopara halstedii]CEG39333.1 hypothetical protein PHALS_09587 [Plasmopara halstedii]|eukprot:XP_024575702.1 hypothetical protein PHALS_09587 [Plasmopara halstedii]
MGWVVKLPTGSSGVAKPETQVQHQCVNLFKLKGEFFQYRKQNQLTKISITVEAHHVLLPIKSSAPKS